MSFGKMSSLNGHTERAKVAAQKKVVAFPNSAGFCNLEFAVRIIFLKF